MLAHPSLIRWWLRAAVVCSFVFVMGVGVVACRSRAYNAASRLEAFRLNADVLGWTGSAVGKLDEATIVANHFVSHDKVLTWEGLVAGVRSATPQVHIIDTKKFDGHFGYTKNAIGRGSTYTQDMFFAEVQTPATRNYMPFLVFDFRASPLSWKGKSYNWVLNIRRYRYGDTHDELASLLMFVKAQVGEKLMKGYGEPLIQVYTTPGSFRRPHIDRLGEVHAKGMATITEDEMIASAGGSLVAVLNPGVGVGYLKIVKTGDDASTERLTPRHIAIFEDMPERIPPVSGIFTLEPQTPLSHVNLLAKNRGTFNVSTQKLDLIPGLVDKVGKLVRVQANGDGRVDVREISTAEAQVFWDARKTFAVEVPAIVSTLKTAVEFSKSTPAETHISVVGSKASNYALIQKELGAPLVRPGGALGFYFYKAIAQQSGAQALIDDLLKNKGTLSPEEIDKRLDAIRLSIQGASSVPAVEEAVQEVKRAIVFLGGIPRIRLRSSTNSEDLPMFNGAGLYESAGWNATDGDDKLKKKLGTVMASLWLGRAFWEREFFGLKHQDVALAVLLNPAFSDEWANGVVVGQEDGGRFRTWVNAQKGEASVTNPLAGEVPESFTFLDDDVATVTVQGRSNIGNVFLNASAGKVTDAMKPLLAQLKVATQRLQKIQVAERRAVGDKLPYGIDIEYKIMDEGGLKLNIKQSRLLNLAASNDPDTNPTKTKKLVAKGNTFGGAHLRRAAKQLSALAAGQWCLLKENDVVAIDRIEDVGAGFSKVNITVNARDCAAFVGETYIFTAHFNLVD